MKTADVKTGCGGCGSVASRVDMVKQATMYLIQGHEGLAQVYDTFQTEATDPMEKIQYGKAALKQRELALMSKEMTLPDAAADEAEALIEATKRDTDPAPAVSK